MRCDAPEPRGVCAGRRTWRCVCARVIRCSSQRDSDRQRLALALITSYNTCRRLRYLRIPPWRRCGAPSPASPAQEFKTESARAHDGKRTQRPPRRRVARRCAFRSPQGWQIARLVRRCVRPRARAKRNAPPQKRSAREGPDAPASALALAKNRPRVPIRPIGLLVAFTHSPRSRRVLGTLGRLWPG